MTKTEYLAYHKQFCEDMIKITTAKNADYSGTSPDPFANFNRVGLMGVCQTEQGFLVRMLDKFCRITSFVQKGVLEVKDESLEDTCKDLANYACLFAAYVKSKKADSIQEGKQIDG